MSLLNTISGDKPFRTTIRTNVKGNGVDGIQSQVLLIVDLVRQENVTREGVLTENPVEEGPDVNDHFRLKPVEIEVQGYISEFPISLSGSLQGAAAAAGGLAGNLLGGFGTVIGANVASKIIKALPGAQDPAAEGRRVLEQIQETGTQVTVDCKRKSYSNMILTMLSFPRSQSTGKGLEFTARFKNINTVSAQTVLIKNIARSAAAGAGPRSKLGSQTTTPPSDQTQNKSSILFKGFKGLFGGG